MGPIDIPGWQDRLNLLTAQRILISLGRRSPMFACRLAGPFLMREFDPERAGILERMKATMAPADHFLLNDPKVAAAVLGDAAEALGRARLASPGTHDVHPSHGDFASPTLRRAFTSGTAKRTSRFRPSLGEPWNRFPHC